MCTCLPHWVSHFLVLVKVCQSPMFSQHFASSVRPTSVDRTYSALPSCWRAPARPSHVRHSYVTVRPSHGNSCELRSARRVLSVPRYHEQHGATCLVPSTTRPSHVLRPMSCATAHARAACALRPDYPAIGLRQCGPRHARVLRAVRPTASKPLHGLHTLFVPFSAFSARGGC